MSITENKLNKNIFCILPWIHTRIEANGDINQCCMCPNANPHGNLKSSSLLEILNSKSYKEIRKELLSNNFPEKCKTCYLLESAGEKTLRIRANEKYAGLIDKYINATDPDGTIKNPSIISIDLIFSNFCNFKCRTCYQGASSAWYEDANILSGSKDFKNILRPTRTKNELWALLENLIPHLREVYILGGEPLLENDQYLFLEKLIKMKRTDIEIRYSTNLSHLRVGEKRIFAYLEFFKNTTMMLSYDGCGKKGELIRKGMNWNKTVENHKIIQNKSSQVKLVVSTTLSVLNAFHLIELIDTLIHEKMIHSGEDFTISILNQPSFYCINIFNQDEKKALSHLYRHSIDNLMLSNFPNVNFIINQLEMVIRFLDQNNSDLDIKLERKKFVIHNSRLDKIRKENLVQLFPEIRNLFLDALNDS